jgi:alpha-N-arabinofuranosidase
MLPRLDATAAKDKEGKIWIAVTNLDPTHPADMQITAEGGHYRAASGQTLAAPHIDSINTFDAPLTVEPKPITATKGSAGAISLRLPPASVTVISLQPEGA